MANVFRLHLIFLLMFGYTFGIQGAATSSSTNTLTTAHGEDNSDEKRSSAITTTSREVQPGIHELLQRHKMPWPLVEIILDYEARNGAYKSLDSRFSRFPWNEIRNFFSYVHNWSRTSVRHHHIITPDEQQRESALGTVVQIGVSQHHKDLKYFRVSPSCMYKAYINKGNLIVVDALYHNTYMEIRGGSEFRFIDCNLSPTVGINENRVAALVMHGSKLFVYIWLIGESVPEQILPVPLDTVENVDQCMLSLGEESYASCLKVALYVPSSLEGKGVVYCWNVNIATVDHEYVPTIFDVSYEPSREHRSMRWLAVLPDGSPFYSEALYLCIDRFNLLTNCDKEDGRGERLEQVGSYSNDLDMFIGSVVSAVNDVLCDVPAFLAKDEEDEDKLAELLKDCDKKISDDFTKNSIVRLLIEYNAQQKRRLCVVRTVTTNGARGNPTRMRTAVLRKWPAWVLENSNDLTWMIERICREKKQLGADSVKWETLSQQEKNLLTTAPPVARSFIASSLKISGVLPNNCMQGDLDLLKFGKMSRERYELYNQYVAKKRFHVDLWNLREHEWQEQREKKEEVRRVQKAAQQDRREKERRAREAEEAKRRADEWATEQAHYAAEEKKRIDELDRRAREQEAVQAQRLEEIKRAAETKALQEQKERADKEAALAEERKREQAEAAERFRKYEIIESIDSRICEEIERVFDWPYPENSEGRKYLLLLKTHNCTDLSWLSEAAPKEQIVNLIDCSDHHKRYLIYKDIVVKKLKDTGCANFSDYQVQEKLGDALARAYMRPPNRDSDPYDVLQPKKSVVLSRKTVAAKKPFVRPQGRMQIRSLAYVAVGVSGLMLYKNRRTIADCAAKIAQRCFKRKVKIAQI